MKLKSYEIMNAIHNCSSLRQCNFDITSRDTFIPLCFLLVNKEYVAEVNNIPLEWKWLNMSMILVIASIWGRRGQLSSWSLWSEVLFRILVEALISVHIMEVFKRYLPLFQPHVVLVSSLEGTSPANHQFLPLTW